MLHPITMDVFVLCTVSIVGGEKLDLPNHPSMTARNLWARGPSDGNPILSMNSENLCDWLTPSTSKGLK